jgi:hypothetical protein
MVAAGAEFDAKNTATTATSVKPNNDLIRLQAVLAGLKIGRAINHRL